MTIYEVKNRVVNAPHFFDRKTLKFFGQTMRDFKVHKINDRFYKVFADMKVDGKWSGKTERIFDSETNRLINNREYEKLNEEHERFMYLKTVND